MEKYESIKEKRVAAANARWNKNKNNNAKKQNVNQKQCKCIKGISKAMQMHTRIDTLVIQNYAN